VINTYQLHSGLLRPILEDTRSCPWIATGWVSSLRQFLHTIHGQIKLADPWTLPSQRHHDRHLMDDISQLQISHRELQLLNNVCMYLRVTTLSELSNQTGTHVLQQYLTSPDLDSNYSQIYPHPGSTLSWPTQTLPGPQAWKVWRQTVTNLYCHTSTTKLLQPLGEWIPDTYDQYWVWAWYICIPTNFLYHRQGTQWNVYAPRTHRRTYALFHSLPDNIQLILPQHTTPVTPIFTRQGIRIDLPAAPIPDKLQPIPEQLTLRIHQRLISPPTGWEDKLWADIKAQT